MDNQGCKLLGKFDNKICIFCLAHKCDDSSDTEDTSDMLDILQDGALISLFGNIDV